MRLRLIDDVNKAFEAGCYFSSLSLVITFPDICGKAEYPQEKSTAKRYKDWYDEYIGKYEQCTCKNCRNTPTLLKWRSGIQFKKLFIASGDTQYRSS